MVVARPSSFRAPANPYPSFGVGVPTHTALLTMDDDFAAPRDDAEDAWTVSLLRHAALRKSERHINSPFESDEGIFALKSRSFLRPLPCAEGLAQKITVWEQCRGLLRTLPDLHEEILPLGHRMHHAIGEPQEREIRVEGGEVMSPQFLIHERTALPDVPRTVLTVEVPLEA